MTDILAVSTWVSPLIDAPFWTLITLRITALLALAWLAHFALARANPRWRVLLWRTVAVGLLALPLLNFGVPSVDLAIETSRLSGTGFVSPQASEPKRPATLAGAEALSDSPAMAGDSAAFSPLAASPRSRLRLSHFVLAAWIAGMLLLAVRLLGGCLKIQAVVRRSKPVPQWLDEEYRRVEQALSKPIHAELKLSAEISTPLLCGLRQPVLLLPARMENESARDRMPGVLSHELTHVHGGDLHWNLWLHVASILLWFHPLVWRIRSACAAAREEVCDAVSAGVVGDVATYSRILASEVIEMAGPIPATSIPMARTSEIGRRLGTLKRRVFNMSLQRHQVIAFLTAATMGLLVIGCVSFVHALDDPVSEPTANDAKLNEGQKGYRDWTEKTFANMLSPLASMNAEQKAAKEAELLQQIQSSSGKKAIPAINGLAELRSGKAVPALLKLAADRREKDNRDRWMAVRALGLIGDKSVVPDLVHLTYHYNQNTRFWAQISLVRLTGQNFERDVDAWRKWWTSAGNKPPIPEKTVAWTWRGDWADPVAQEKSDKEFVDSLKPKSTAKAPSLTHSPTPHIIATSPIVGATDVDPAITEITVTFDRDMGGGFSWTGGGPDFPTSPEGTKAHWRDKRTCVFPVKLAPGKYYRVGINSKSYQNFRGANGFSAKPSAIYFTTKGASSALKSKIQKPMVVSMSPANGARDVDPGTKELRITFSVPMGGGFSWTGGGPQFPAIPEGKRPFWTEDKKTCVLPVALKPAWDYRLGLNSPSHKNFSSAAGVPLDMVEYKFSTRRR